MAARRESPFGTRVSRAELVARKLEREIVDDLAAGDRLGTKDDLRRRFGVAVATINEAVRLLETHGLIEARPGPSGGVFVSGPGARLAMAHAVLGFASETRTYEECLELRDALEPLVDRYAARYHRAADIRGIYLTMIDFLQETVAQAPVPAFDGEAMLEVHRDLVAAIDAGEGPDLDAAVAAHRPTQRLVGRRPER